MTKNIAQRIRQSYERRPYPAGHTSGRLRPKWLIAPLEWIDAMSSPSRFDPRRILVAGCGTGNEAFALRKRLPKAEIVAVDFSPRSIDIARKLQRKFRGQNEIAFLRADLAARDFDKTVRGPFDFISCHGVLSYIPQPERTLQNLASVLALGGVLYLGVNGARHFSATWRPAAAEFGLDPAAFNDSRALRDVLRLFDALSGHSGDWVTRQTPEYLASDLFCAMISNQPLDSWIGLTKRCGFHFRGSYTAHRTLRGVLNNNLSDRLIPRSRPEVHAIAEQIVPSPFHRLLFTREPAPPSPWKSGEHLSAWRVCLTRLYQPRWPLSRKTPGQLHSLRLESQPTNTLVELQVRKWALDLLRESDGQRSIAEILRAQRHRVSGPTLRKQLYLLELLGAINLLPPPSGGKQVLASAQRPRH